MAYVDDGLWDVAVGLGMVAFALGTRWDAASLGVVLWVLLVPLVWSMKRSITVPRLQPPPPPPRMALRGAVALAVALGVTALLGVLVLVTASGGLWRVGFVRDLDPLPVGAVVAAVIAVVGYLYASPRWYAYGAAIAAVFLAGWLLDWEAWVSFCLAGAALAGSGAIVLRRFLRDHPGPAGA
jgi:hypothetical protein